jgi:predicted dehydrogenase
MNQKVKVAIIGFGHLGKWHVEKAISHPHAQLIGIVERDHSIRELAQAKYPDINIYEQVEEILELADAAFIVTPTSSHHQLLKILIANDVHVFCEKPLTSSSEEASEIQQLASEKSLVIQIGHSERFHQIWSEKARFANYLEAPATIRINRLAPFKSRATDVDVVQDLMIHDLDLLNWFLGESPVSIKSTGYKIRTDKWDFVCSELSYKNGIRAIITVGRNHVEEVRDFEVTNSNGCFKVDLFKNTVHFAAGDANVNFVESEQYLKRDHLYCEHEHFYKSIQENHPLIVSLQDGLNAVKLIDYVLESLDTGKEVVLND